MGLPRPAEILSRLERVGRHEQFVLAGLAVVIGLIGGCAAIVFREAIEVFQLLFYGFASEYVHSNVAGLPWSCRPIGVREWD